MSTNEETRPNIDDVRMEKAKKTNANLIFLILSTVTVLVMPSFIVRGMAFAFLGQIIYAVAIAYFMTVMRKSKPIIIVVAAVLGIISVAITLFLANYYNALTCMSGLLLGLTIGVGLRLKFGFNELFVLSAAAYLIPIVVSLSLYDNFYGVGAFSEVVGGFFEEFKQFIFNTTGVVNQVTTEGSLVNLQKDMGLYVETLHNAFVYSLPAIYTIVSMIIAYVSIRFTGMFLWDRRDVSRLIPPFFTLRLSRSVPIVLLISVLLTFSLKSELYATVFDNIYTILMFAAFACGLSVIDFYLMWRIPVGTVRFIIYLTVIFLATDSLIPFLTVIGLIDSMFKLRVVRISNNNLQ